MKNFLIFLMLLFLAFSSVKAQNFVDDYSGRWAEKISERVVMDIFPDTCKEEYQIFITWREDYLAQKDIYRFKAKLDKDGVLQYKNGIHKYRIYDLKGNFEDKDDYTDGSGTIMIKGNELVWKDNKDKRESIFIRANKSLLKDTYLKNKMFSFILPEELKGLYTVKAKKDKISIYDKASKRAKFGGFAFGIKAYKNPSDHAVLPGGRKIGELTDQKGVLYDVVLKFPTDVQYDYTQNEVPDSYKVLYDVGNIISIKGVNGSKFFKNQGMKGEDLYKDILKKHAKAIIEKRDSAYLENNDMSYMYNVIAENNKNPLDKIGYAYYDLNADGIEELVIGEIAEGNWKSVIYDIYTMVNRVPKHVISGGSRNRYFACDGTFICNEYSSGALESGVRVYILVENSTELFPQVSFKYDGYIHSKTPWFLSYGNEAEDDKWENVSEKIFKERKQVFDKYERFNFIPLSEFVKNNCF